MTYIIRDKQTGAEVGEADTMSEAIAIIMDIEFGDMLRGVYEIDNYEIEMKGEKGDRD